MAYFLRTTKADGTSYHGFQWPREVGAIVEAPDWNPEPKCGGGLHGLRDGLGDGDLLDWSTDALWWIVEADDADCVDLGRKWKFPRCKVVAFGQRYEITTRLHDRRPGPIHGLSITAGDSCTATVGYRGTATAGECGTATAGDYGTATAGDYGTATAGYRGTATAADYGTATAGECGTATAGDYGTATAGYRGTATAGYRGTATAGECGTATAGYRGTATAGECGTATAGDYGTATAGYRGTLVFFRWLDGRRRALVAYVGEDGIKPGVAYRANDDHTAVVKAA